VFLPHQLRCPCRLLPPAMRLAGKRIRSRWLGQLNAVGSLIFLLEEDSGKSYLVDTGAAVSVVPFGRRPSAAKAYLTGPDSTVIPAWGTVTLTLRFGGRQLSGSFVREAVSKPILGVDFLARHKLLVDAVGRRVLSADSLKPLSPPSILHSPPQSATSPLRFESCWQHFRPLSATVQLGHSHGMEWSTWSRPLVSRCMPKRGGWTPTSSAPPKLNFALWKPPESFAAPIHQGHRLYTWSPRKMAPAVTTGG
jgi:hypothetical protein